MKKVSCQALEKWASKNRPGEDMTFKKNYWIQIFFVQDVVLKLLFSSGEEYEDNPVKVLSTHTSKDIELPVYLIEIPSGPRFILRYNFIDWKISVDSPVDINADFLGLFNPKEHIKSGFCEGFPKGTVYGCYAKSKKKFTVELGKDYNVYAFFLILSSALNLRKK